MVGFYEPRTTNNGLSLGLRCGIAPRQIHEMNAVRRWPVAVRKKKRPPIGAFFTSRGLLEAMSLFWVCCRAAAFESEATGGLRTATGGADRPQSTLTIP